MQRYFPDKPGRQGYGALLFRASYASWPGKVPPVCWSPDDYMTVVSLDALTPPAHDDLTAPLWADVAAVRHRGRPRRE